MENLLSAAPVYVGSCHCGAVQFTVAAEVTDIYRCDCSLCRMKGALMTSVHEDAFTLRTGADVAVGASVLVRMLESLILTL